MNEQFDYTSQTDNIATTHNQVLRNTYMLLAITMIPTILGAWIGLPVLAGMISVIGGTATMIACLAVAIAFPFAIRAYRNASTGIALLLIYTFFMGILLAPTIMFTLQTYTNGSELIMMAFGATAMIFFTLAGIAATTKRDFSGLGTFLFTGLILLLLASIANIFLRIPAMELAIAAVGVMIFSGYILYDVQRIVKGGETNYITATLSIYLDIINIFIYLLRIITALAGNRR